MRNALPILMLLAGTWSLSQEPAPAPAADPGVERQEAQPAQPAPLPDPAPGVEKAAQPAAPAGPPVAASREKATILYIERFSTDTALADTNRKADRIEEIPESQLMKLQEVILSDIKGTHLFTDVRVLKPGEKPVLKDGEEAWIFGGQFLDYKKGSQAARYFIGFGAGKQKVEVLATVRDARNGVQVHEERIVDRKVGGFFGGDGDKGLKDFAERITALMRRLKTGA